MIHDEALEQVERDLDIWAKWVNGEKVNRGYGNSPISRIDKDETRQIKRSKRDKSPTLTILYRDGRQVAAQYGEERVLIPVQEITTPKTKPFTQQYDQPQAHDDLCLEIEGYMAILKTRDKVARILADHIYRFGWSREKSLQTLRITKDRYTQIKDYIPVFILSRRYEKLTLGRPNVIRV